MKSKYEVFLAPVTEEQIKAGAHQGYALQDILDDKVDLPDEAFLYTLEGEAVPIPYGGVKNYARKLIEQGLDAKTKVAFGVKAGFSEEEIAKFSKMTKQQAIEYLRKEAEAGRRLPPLFIRQKKS